ncbi:MAG: winged helix-turn-helix domain-containing protein [Planctomycetia bacterium]|nr:winged helix-turn-helix domain-containing protein [Planctomycetia bacterium]
MRQKHFTDLQLKALDEARFCQKTDAINRRVNAVYFRGLGRTQREAALLAKVSLNTLRKAVAAFEFGGIAALVADAREGPPSALDPYAERLKAEFTAHPPANVAQAADRIAQLTGVRRQATQVRTFLHQLGMAPRRLAPIPGKANPQQQALFKKTNWTQC